MKNLLLLLVGFVLLIGPSYAAPRAHRHGRPVIIKVGHKHTARCGHYHHKGKWFLVSGHEHGPRCGHRLRGGLWVRL